MRPQPSVSPGTVRPSRRSVTSGALLGRPVSGAPGRAAVTLRLRRPPRRRHGAALTAFLNTVLPQWRGEVVSCGLDEGAGAEPVAAGAERREIRPDSPLPRQSGCSPLTAQRLASLGPGEGASASLSTLLSLSLEPACVSHVPSYDSAKLEQLRYYLTRLLLGLNLVVGKLHGGKSRSP